MDLSPSELHARIGSWDGGAGPLYQQLATAIAAAVREGVIAPGTRLPPERLLARELSVSRGTVMSCYAELRTREIVSTRQGSGTVVREDASPVTGSREAHLLATLPATTIYHGILGDDDAIDLRGAHWSGTDDLPDGLFEIAGDDLAAITTGHGYAAAGLPDLRRAIAAHLTDSGLETEPDEVIVTTGAHQAIDLLAELLLDPGDVAVMEDPTYPAALEAFRTRRAQVVGVPLGPAGVDVPALERAIATHHPHLVYLMPAAHNPTGRVSGAQTRRRLAELAAATDVVLVDDRTLAPLTLTGDAELPPVGAYTDAPTRIVTIGSLSKVLWGGLRIGWLRAPRQILSRLLRLKALRDLGTPVHSQLVAARALPTLDELARRRRESMAARRDVLVEALATHLPEWRFELPQGGMCLWVEVPDTAVEAFAITALRHGVGIVPGTAFSPSGGFAQHVRLPYGQRPETITAAIERLAVAWDDHRHGALRLGGTGMVV